MGGLKKLMHLIMATQNKSVIEDPSAEMHNPALPPITSVKFGGNWPTSNSSCADKLYY